jgi:exodeoxyribonuclease VII large subunit
MYKNIIKNNIFNISEYIEFINNILKECTVKITGEVGFVKKSSAGHVYFSLKDENSVLDCVIWSYQYKMCGINIEEGMQLIAIGESSIYAPTGRFSFKASKIQLVGQGELKKQYDQLKQKLERQGFFERELELKDYPQNIGLITSKHGAVIHDFLNNLGKFNFKVEFIDSRVEGIEAVDDLLNAIKSFQDKDIDTLVIMRGGGSLESFLAFNNEEVIKEAHKLKIPLITGLGHHEDEPLLALASDYNVSTPTAVANLLNESWEKAIYEIEKQEKAIFNHFIQILNNFNFKIKTIEKSFDLFKKEIKRKENTIDELNTNINKLFKFHIQKTKEKILSLEKNINQNNPKRQLKLGYSIARINGKIIKNINQINEEDLFDLELSDGIIKSKVEEKYGKTKHRK